MHAQGNKSSIFALYTGDSIEERTGYGTIRPRNLISSILGQTPVKSKSLAISNPHDFRQVRCSAMFNVHLKLTEYDF